MEAPSQPDVYVQKEHHKMPQNTLTEYVEALEKAGLLTRFQDEKRVDELPKLMDDNPGTAIFVELDFDIEGVRFLNACVAKGISVLHCSPYIREWMFREGSEGCVRNHPFRDQSVMLNLEKLHSQKGVTKCHLFKFSPEKV
jgi:hypothetical protein